MNDVSLLEFYSKHVYISHIFFYVFIFYFY
jgi:hypothetical protein